MIGVVLMIYENESSRPDFAKGSHSTAPNRSWIGRPNSGGDRRRRDWTNDRRTNGQLHGRL